LTFAPRKNPTDNPVGNLTHHSYHATASANIAHVSYECKHFFALPAKKVSQLHARMEKETFWDGKTQKCLMFSKKTESVSEAWRSY
jgi:hypothetical protein